MTPFKALYGRDPLLILKGVKWTLSLTKSHKTDLSGKVYTHIYTVNSPYL